MSVTNETEGNLRSSSGSRHKRSQRRHLGAARLEGSNWAIFPSLRNSVFLMVLVKDINPGSASPYPGPLTYMNGTLFFTAYDGTNIGLWQTDGTGPGTVLVTSFSGVFPERKLTNANGTLFFATYSFSSNTYNELWKSDGTAGGTVPLKDINDLGSVSNGGPSLTNVGSTVFFSANDGTNGWELWKSDGSAGGTVLVKDINPGSESSYPQSLIDANGTLFLSASDPHNGRELWKSDGSDAGTVLIKDINAVTLDSNPNQLVASNGALFFTADDGIHGSQPWKSDGTATTVVTNAITNPGDLTDVNGMLFLSANDGVNGSELWKSDGTAAGTVMVADLNPGSGGSYPSNITNINGSIYFDAVFTDSNGSYVTAVWKSDGTASGTIQLAQVYGADFTPLNGMVFFRDGYGLLWKTDGTAAGTSFLFGGVQSDLAVVNGKLMFARDDGVNGDELWESDGTVAGTVLVKDIYPGTTTFTYKDCGYGYSRGHCQTFKATRANTSSPQSLINVNGTLYFTANDATHGRELWRSDGTAGGTVLVADINPRSAGSYPMSLANVNGTLFFAANDGTHGGELWKSDGTAAGTVLVKDINPGTAWSYPAHLTNVNGTLYFSANDGTQGNELWQSNGTAAGTVLVADINPGSASSNPANLTLAGTHLFFTADDGFHGTELWDPPIGAAPAPVGVPPAEENSNSGDGLALRAFPDEGDAGAAVFSTVAASLSRHEQDITRSLADDPAGSALPLPIDIPSTGVLDQIFAEAAVGPKTSRFALSWNRPWNTDLQDDLAFSGQFG